MISITYVEYVVKSSFRYSIPLESYSVLDATFFHMAMKISKKPLDRW